MPYDDAQQTLSLPDEQRMTLGPLGRSLGFLLRISQVTVFEKFYATLGDLGLKPGEFSVLWLICNNPGIRQGVVARNLHIKNARMTKLIRTFEDKGFVSRLVPDDDRRAVELTLTSEGRAFVDANAEDFFTYSQKGKSRLTPEEMGELIRLLQKYTGMEETE
ncbi:MULTISPECIES: MarR family winged helix-turn-helix transcriptional regulator [Alphaproteobacteria]|uniref:MarR family transcriptional regulator n=2 Tax=Alphaproteobacteria TaxID=28211 RepID=A0A512HH48_9HYPH|nr:MULTISPECIES: MarR family transcriptional regulator [Alphaproteobacteria]GEO84761.1 MarR family transcriptional regulator [Ciceribacter naphthalenivorans]GLR20618.1 MarR family transcriptional regulator [Ciceribacter naphthalenivorans]GLT03474.1 MarR family transcriptional regulator [Sphingomonas psychrolutea]